MAITKVINDLIDLNQTGDYSGIRLPAGTTADRTQTFTTDYLVVGGGGGGARGYAGGGGAGGLRTSYNNSTTTTNLLSFPSGKTAMATYMLNGDATDVSTNYNGAESSITYVAGEYGGAASFNGSNSSIQINTFSGFTNYNFTLSIWIKTTDTVGYITSFRDPIYITFGTGIYSAGSNGMGIYDGTNSYYINNTAMQGINDGNWHHIAMTHDGTNLKGYIDGSIIATVSTGTTTQSSGGTNYNRIGLRADGNTSSAYNGLVDQLRLYNSALSENDISNIYNNEVQANSGGGSVAESSLTLTEGTAYDVTVGAGGIDTYTSGGSSSNGASSIFSTITSLGGGGAGATSSGSTAASGKNGGSGGGAGSNTSGSPGNGTLGQGYIGGTALFYGGSYAGGGGGGALSPGGNSASSTVAGNGGSQLNLAITGTSIGYAGGGGGSLYGTGTVGTNDSSGGPAAPSSGSSASGGPAPYNLGGGGGGANHRSGTTNIFGGSGGSGVVILRYPTASVSSFTATGTLNTPSTTDTLASATYPITNTAYYKLDGDAADSSGNGYNGNDSNVTWQNGRFGQAAVFNGSSSYISGTVSATATTSFSMWVKINDTSSSQFIQVFDNNNFAIFIYSGKLNIQYASGSNSNGVAWTISNASSWNHIAGTFTSSSSTLYVNGVQKTESMNNWVNAESVPYIGNRNALDGYFNGEIDQVRIFSSALTSSQVTQLYEEHYQTKFTDGSDTAIVFTEGTGTVTFDGTNPPAPQGALRTNTSYSEDGSASVIEHYNGADWKYFDAIKYCTTNTLNFPSGAGCVASYNLNNNVNDIGNTYSGTNNNATFNASGKFGAAGVFNGSNAFVDSGFTALSSTEASISFWVNIAAYTAYGGFVGDSTGSGAAARFFLGQGGGTSGNLWVSIGNGSSSWNDETTVSLTSYGLNKWFHLVGTVDGTTVKIYINGSLVHTYTSSISYAGTGTLPYYFGGWGNSLFLNGELDQIRFFTTALTLAQVQDLYNNEIACS